MVMPANSGKAIVHYWAGRYPGLVGHLYSPDGWRGPFPWLPYGLDNGAFPAYTKGVPWNADAFRALVSRAAAVEQSPLWVVVPDVVGDARETLRMWDEWAPRLRHYGWPLALALQDGMTPADAQAAGPDVLFLGGTTRWKRQQLGRLDGWRSASERIHVGRINTARWLWRCVEAGVESVDGTGWFRGDPVQTAGLATFLELYAAGERRAPTYQYPLSLSSSCGL